jgi:hypothetical protein
MWEFGACDLAGENSGKFVVGSAADTEADAHAQMLNLFGGEWVVGSGDAERCIIVATVVYQGDKRG